MQDSEFYWMRLNNGKITTIKQTDRIQTSPIWPVVASGLKNLGESDVAEAGRRIPDCQLYITRYRNPNDE